MFDLGFSEIVVIGVVALVVVGPERLPKVARTAGHLLGRAQRYVSDVKADIRREMQLEELQKLQQQVSQQAREFESSVRAGVSSVENQVQTATAELREALPMQSALTAEPAEPSLADNAGASIEQAVAESGAVPVPPPAGAAEEERR